MRLPVSVSRCALTFALLLAPLSLAGCGSKNMQQVAVPEGGVPLTYDLSNGATFEGRVRVGVTQRQEGLGNINQSVAAGVRMVVLGDDPSRGGKLVRATFHDVDVQWTLPPSFPVSADEFLKQAVSQVQGMQVTFNVEPSGKIIYMPDPPEGADAQLAQVITMVLDALDEAFLPMPANPVKQGQAWTEKQQRGREGKLGRYIDGTTTTNFQGLYEKSGRPGDLAKLVIEEKRREVITTKEGKRENEREGKLVAMFSTEGYLAETDGETRDFDPVTGMSFRKVHVELAKTKAGNPAAPSTAQPQPTAPAEQTQEITDPCDPNYVGAEQCQTITDPCDPNYVGAEECKTEAPTEAPAPTK